MSGTCQVCGKQITGILSNFSEHAGKIKYGHLPTTEKTGPRLAGNGAPAARYTAANVFSNGSCPGCRNLLKQGASPYY